MFVGDEDQEDSFTKICCSTSHVQCVEDGDDSMPSIEVSKNCTLPDINPVLSSKEKCDLNSLMQEYLDMFSELPGCTSTVVHKIELGTEKPIRRKMYPVPVRLQDEVNKEVDKLYDLGITEESNSNFTNPIAMVKKPDGSYRLTLDFRALNSVIKFDAEAMPSIHEDYHRFHNAKYVSEIDITKAYYQILLEPSSKPFTAFPTYRGLMQYSRLPFGLVTACATYIRLMRKVFQGVQGISVYFDNIYIISSTFQEHYTTLKEIFQLLREHGLTARPSECHFAYDKIQYLELQIGNNKICPDDEKVRVLSSIPVPKSKKLLRSFLESVNFYRNFIPNLAERSSCLTDKLKKNSPDCLEWTEKETKAFEDMQSTFSNPPILHIPDTAKAFVVRTDASSIGMGAVLLQYEDGLHTQSRLPVRKFYHESKSILQLSVSACRYTGPYVSSISICTEENFS